MRMPRVSPSCGSSPLARGTRVDGYWGCRHRRLIPARAETTAAHAESRQCPGDHPRSRREHGSSARSTHRPHESSPLARGTLSAAEHLKDLVGLIPTHAGNIPVRHGRTSRRPAHPRSRGEHFWNNLLISARAGSSPLALGAPWVIGWLMTGMRLIPARAGSTTHVGMMHQTISAHPRSRGEHTMCDWKPGPRCGSSPLARGTHYRPYRPKPYRRLIPARAGNTLPDEVT